MTQFTYFGGNHRDVVPFGHLSVEGFQRCDGAVHRIDVEQPLEICMPINGVPGRITNILLFIPLKTVNIYVCISCDIAQKMNCTSDLSLLSTLKYSPTS